MKLNSEMWLVVHVPKTAGTSFRQALERYFGEDQVIRDYGPNAVATTEVVRSHLYNNTKKKCPDELLSAIRNSHAKVLVGHYPLRKYIRYFDPENIITFVREPLTRACSEYLHRVNNASFDGSFSDFVNMPSVRNIQSRLLKGMPENSIIGLNEHYRKSLAYINASFGLQLKALKRNVDKKGGGRRLAENLSGTETDLFYELNKDDLALYKTATHRFASLDIPKNTGMRLLNLLKQR